MLIIRKFVRTFKYRADLIDPEDELRPPLAETIFQLEGTSLEEPEDSPFTTA